VFKEMGASRVMLSSRELVLVITLIISSIIYTKGIKREFFHFNCKL
jgi:hypothetical protein